MWSAKVMVALVEDDEVGPPKPIHANSLSLKCQVLDFKTTKEKIKLASEGRWPQTSEAAFGSYKAGFKRHQVEWIQAKSGGHRVLPDFVGASRPNTLWPYVSRSLRHPVQSRLR